MRGEGKIDHNVDTYFFLSNIFLFFLYLYLHSNAKICTLREHLQSTLHGGMSLRCTSDLPAGSGMGGSSILAAAALQSLGQLLLGVAVSSTALVSLVSQVEQILTSGGGWQDQVKILSLL